jgi:hypothetical protein
MEERLHLNIQLEAFQKKANFEFDYLLFFFDVEGIELHKKPAQDFYQYWEEKEFALKEIYSLSSSSKNFWEPPETSQNDLILKYNSKTWLAEKLIEWNLDPWNTILVKKDRDTTLPEGKFLLKENFGHSGKNSKILEGPKTLKPRTDSIIRPLSQRSLDFSTRLIDDEIVFTRNIIDGHGQFWGCMSFEEESLNETQYKAIELIHGHLQNEFPFKTYSVDGFLDERGTSFPACEINFRRTMSHVFQKLKERFSPNELAAWYLFRRPSSLHHFSQLPEEFFSKNVLVTSPLDRYFLSVFCWESTVDKLLNMRSLLRSKLENSTI